MAVESDYYSILGVAPAASPEDIRRAYRQRAFAAHPDRGGSQRQMMRLNEAWEVLGDARRRRAYDAQRPSAAQPARPQTPGRQARQARPRAAKAAGRRPPTLAQIAGALLGRALRALTGDQPTPRARRNGERRRAAVIVRCRHCGQKLRLQRAGTGPGGGRFICPKCRHSAAMG